MLKRARHFITCDGRFYGEENEEKIKAALSASETSDNAVQLSLFSNAALIKSAPENNGFLHDAANGSGGADFSGARLDLPADETQIKIHLSSAEIRRSVLTGEI